GKDFNKRLEALGAKRVFDLVECDVDFESSYDRWATGALNKFKEIAKPAAAAAPVTAAPTFVSGAAAPAYDKANPFPAPLLKKINLNGSGSAKETIHAEISLE